MLLAFLEHDLKGGESDGQQADAGPVHAARGLQRRGVIRGQEEHAHGRGKNAHGHIDEEDPAPAQVIGQPAAEHRADGGPDDDAEPEDRLRDAALLRRERLRR